MSDLISRQSAIDAVDRETVSTNPTDFLAKEKFIPFMNDADVSSFGKWQWSNGFNTALIAARVALKKLPSVETGEKVEANIYDQEEIHENCTVQVLRNSYTGEISVGWWENEEAEE